ncbi:hypothetical protein COF80_27050 [Bacillus toyonensis]|uniref:hypothetical protein n=1 Tax=Bacillus toyonensis TaxID=155322 RepID=UPI000BFDCEF4|nr:hypothetical protein [Bacillus toyonensis]PHE82686.1 hypothetical protein COF80_27050 [Bacillus toyonensis]
MEEKNITVSKYSVCNRLCMWMLKVPLTIITHFDKAYIREANKENADIGIECLEKEVQTNG